MENLEACEMTGIYSGEEECKVKKLEVAQSKTNETRITGDICQVAEVTKDEMENLRLSVVTGDGTAVVPSVGKEISDKIVEVKGHLVMSEETLAMESNIKIRGTYDFTPERNVGVVVSPTFIAEESFDLSTVNMREVETPNYDCSESSCEGEEVEFSPEKFLAVVAASTFKETEGGVKEIHKNDVNQSNVDVSFAEGNQSIKKQGCEYEGIADGLQAVPVGERRSERSATKIYLEESNYDEHVIPTIVFVADGERNQQMITHYHERSTCGRKVQKANEKPCGTEQSVPVDPRYNTTEKHRNSSQHVTANVETKLDHSSRRNELRHFVADDKDGSGDCCPDKDSQSVPDYVTRETQQRASEVEKQPRYTESASQTEHCVNQEISRDNSSKQPLEYGTPSGFSKHVPDNQPLEATGIAINQDFARVDPPPGEMNSSSSHARDTSQAATKPAGKRRSYIQHQIFYVDGGGEEPENSSQERKRRVYRVKPSVSDRRGSQENPKTACSFVPIAPRPKDPVLPPEARGIAPKPPGHENRQFSPPKKRIRTRGSSIPYYVVVVPAPALYRRVAEKRASQTEMSFAGRQEPAVRTNSTTGWRNSRSVQFVPPRPRSPSTNSSLMSTLMRVSPRYVSRTEINSPFITVSTTRTPITPLSGRTQQFIINHGNYGGRSTESEPNGQCCDKRDRRNARTGEIRLPEDRSKHKQSRYAMLREKLNTKSKSKSEINKTTDSENSCLLTDDSRVVPQKEPKQMDSGRIATRSSSAEAKMKKRSRKDPVKRKKRDRELRDRTNEGLAELRELVPSANAQIPKIPLLRLAAKYIEELHSQIDGLKSQVVSVDSSPDLQCAERFTDSSGCSPNSADSQFTKEQIMLTDDTNEGGYDCKEEQTLNSALIGSDNEHVNTTSLVCDDDCNAENQEELHFVPLTTADSYSALIQQISSVLGPMSPNDQDSQTGEPQSRFIPFLEFSNRDHSTTGNDCISPQTSIIPCIGPTVNEETMLNLGLTLSPFSSTVLPSPLTTPRCNVNEGNTSQVDTPYITETLLSPCQIVEGLVTLQSQTPDENQMPSVGQPFTQPIAANIEIVTTPPAASSIERYTRAQSCQNDSYGLDIVSEAVALVDQRGKEDVLQTPKSRKATVLRYPLVSYNSTEKECSLDRNNDLSKSSPNLAKKGSKLGPRLEQLVSPTSRTAQKSRGRRKKESPLKLHSLYRETVTSGENMVDVLELPESPLARLQPVSQCAKKSSTKTRNRDDIDSVVSRPDVMGEFITKLNSTPPGTALVISPSRPRKRKSAMSGRCRKTRGKRRRV